MLLVVQLCGVSHAFWPPAQRTHVRVACRACWLALAGLVLAAVWWCLLACLCRDWCRTPCVLTRFCRGHGRASPVVGNVLLLALL
jgi:hypothetical protein